MRPTHASATADVPAPAPKPTFYRVTFDFEGKSFIAHVHAYTREGAAAEAAELLRDEDFFVPERARCVSVEAV